MKITDPIADMLTRIRNGLGAHARYVDVPRSKLKLHIARILKEEGYVENFVVNETGPQGTIRITLKYTGGHEPVIQGLRRVSKPGRREYRSKDALPKVMSGLGVAILSTSKGVMTGETAKEQGLGGEVLCAVW
ncbi:MAG: 30S ribosomal protein S8 [Acidobacteriota bacterium]